MENEIEKLVLENKQLKEKNEELKTNINKILDLLSKYGVEDFERLEMILIFAQYLS